MATTKLTERMTSQPQCIYSTINRLQKSCLAEKRHFYTESVFKKGDNSRGTGAQKLPFTPLENLSNQREDSPMMAHRRTKFDPLSTQAALLVGGKLPRSSGGNIKEKISLWEGKEPPGSSGPCVSVKKTESLVQNSYKSTEEQDAERCWRKDNVARENGDSRPCSPSKCRQDIGGTIKSSKPKESLQAEDCSGDVRQDYEKENVENLAAARPSSLAETGGFRVSKKLNGNQTGADCRGAQKENCKEHLEKMGDSKLCSPVQEQVGTLRRSSDRKSPAQTSQEKRAVFTLFRKLEAMGENPGRTPPELGNYFSPPSKDKYMEFKKKEAPESSQAGSVTNSGAAERLQNWENVYAEPGAPPINPVPKPQRTFQHPSFERSQRKGRGQRNLPPLPNISAKPPSGVFLRPRGGRAGDTTNRKSLEFEDLFSHSRSQEHHYEDILDSSNENPYEDIELESQCSQQSLPSSPGADSTKAARPGFFRQNSARSFKLLDLRRSNQSPHSTSSGGLSSPAQLSPPSTPAGLEHAPWPSVCSYSRSGYRIPTVVLRINSIFEARVGKKHLRRIYHYAETSSGRVTDENSDSESEIEERSKAHRQRLVSVQSILSRPGRAQASRSGGSMEPELHQRQLFEYFLVVSLQKPKAGGHYLPEVTQQFPLKLERSFKFMRETEDQLRIIPQFCFPDAIDWEPVESYPSEMFAFVLTGEDGSRRFGYCRRLLVNTVQ